MQCGDSVWTFQLKESAPRVWRLTYFLAKIESDVSWTCNTMIMLPLNDFSVLNGGTPHDFWCALQLRSVWFWRMWIIEKGFLESLIFGSNERLIRNSKSSRKVTSLGPFAWSMVSTNHWFRCIETYWFLWWLTLVGADRASRNSVQISDHSLWRRANARTVSFVIFLRW